MRYSFSNSWFKKTFPWVCIRRAKSFRRVSGLETVVPRVALRGIVKQFPGVLANDRIDFILERGEVHTLLGENGSGKSTLMNILAGIYQPDEGVIEIDGRPLALRSPRDAIAAGLGMVHQHFKLVPTHTVAENVVLGMRDHGWLPDLRSLEKRLEDLAKRYGMGLDVKVQVSQLSIGEQQQLEILKAVYRGADILILDEPTSVLTPQESRGLFNTIRHMASDGRSIVFISHKMEEVMAISTRITVLRQGRVAATRKPEETDERELARLMVGRDVLFRTRATGRSLGEVILKLRDVCADNDRLLPSLRQIGFQVRAGEIFGIAGVAGNGQQELGQVINGLRSITSGRILIHGKPVQNLHPAIIIEEGVAYVPADRSGVGSVPNLPITDNAILKRFREKLFQRNRLRRNVEVGAFADQLIRRFEIATPGRNTRAGNLSGGNLQKLILARELSVTPRLLVAVYPTRGLDVGATEFLRNALLESCREGTAILLISEDLEELNALCDRIGVLHGGELMGVVNSAEVDVETLGLMMAGRKLADAGQPAAGG